uniref:Integrase, catalytic region, zinc finger, CCHC-type, peptidase aspartic, catalytic n=1 Tax=Tanacetum cinerariifolium TaxID=118510 RepID=A0A6L2JRZ1_TANCI|nr:hypothetical protein [Tanacetum cinerariifolium]
MLMYIKGKENGQTLLDFMLSGPFQFKVITIPSNVEINRAEEKRMQTPADLTADEKKRKECDIRAANIILQGLPDDIYTLLTQMKIVNTIWYMVNKLMEEKGETIQSYYLNGIEMKSPQINIKFLNNLRLDGEDLLVE